MDFFPIMSSNTIIFCEDRVSFISLNEYRMQTVVSLSMFQRSLTFTFWFYRLKEPAKSQSHWVVILSSGAYKHTALQRQLEIQREYTHVSCMTVPAGSLS